VEEIITGWKNW